MRSLFLFSHMIFFFSYFTSCCSCISIRKKSLSLSQLLTRQRSLSITSGEEQTELGVRLELRVEDLLQAGQEVRVPAGDQLQVLDDQPAALLGQIQQSGLRGCPKVGLTDVQRGDCVRVFGRRGFDDGVQNVDEGVSWAENA